MSTLRITDIVVQEPNNVWNDTGEKLSTKIESKKIFLLRLLSQYGLTFPFLTFPFLAVIM